MKKLVLISTLFVSVGVCSTAVSAKEKSTIISKEQAIDAALAEVGVEVLGIRHYAPDSQWDVFVRVGEQAYEFEVDATSEKIVAA